jgi:DNA-binding MarR family transcriptional regulator
LIEERYEEYESREPALTNSQRTVLSILQDGQSDGMTPSQIIGKVSFAPRTVRYALRKLLSMKLVKRYPCLEDMRQFIYMPN